MSLSQLSVIEKGKGGKLGFMCQPPKGYFYLPNLKIDVCFELAESLHTFGQNWFFCGFLAVYSVLVVFFMVLKIWFLNTTKRLAKKNQFR